MRRFFIVLALAVGLLLPAACATLAPPEDKALTARVYEAIGPEYTRDVTVIAVGNRVYLSGIVEHYSDLQNICGTISNVPGVTTVMDKGVRIRDFIGGGGDSKD